jgi:hypothetical protein
MGPPNGGPEGNNHEDGEVGDSDGQIWKSAVGVSVYSQHAPHQSPYRPARLLRLLDLDRLTLDLDRLALDQDRLTLDQGEPDPRLAPVLLHLG